MTPPTSPLERDEHEDDVMEWFERDEHEDDVMEWFSRDDMDVIMISSSTEDKKPLKRSRSFELTSAEEKLLFSPPEKARFQLCCFKVNYQTPFKAGNLFGYLIASGIPGKSQLLSIDPCFEYDSLFHHEHWANEGVYRTRTLYPNHSASVSASTYLEIVSKLFLTVKDENKYIQLANEYYGIDFLEIWKKRDYQGCDSITLDGDDGSIKLYYFVIKSAVNAVLEVSFEGEDGFYNNDDFIVRIYAFYDNDFEIKVSDRDEKHCYKMKIFETGSVKSLSKIQKGKLPLMQSVVAVPDTSSLIIDAFISDRKGDVLMNRVHKFNAQLKEPTETACMNGVGCFFTVRVDWKPL